MRLRRKTKACSGDVARLVATAAAAAVLVHSSACGRRGHPGCRLLHRPVRDDTLRKLLLGLGETGIGRPIQAMNLRTHRQMQSLHVEWKGIVATRNEYTRRNQIIVGARTSQSVYQ